MKISILDMAAVFSKMNHQTVSPCQLNENGRCQRVGIGPSASLSQGRYMVNIHAEPSHSPSLHSYATG
jgi:hypothetical protein